MKTHVRHIAVGGIVGPLTLLLATMIANEGQTLLGLHLDKTSLAVYLTPFLLGAAAVLHAQIRLEGDKIGKELGSLLGGIDLGGLFGGAPAGAAGGPPPGMPPGMPAPAPLTPPVMPPVPPAPLGTPPPPPGP
jgi:hypothetical protein